MWSTFLKIWGGSDSIRVAESWRESIITALKSWWPTETVLIDFRCSTWVDIDRHVQLAIATSVKYYIGRECHLILIIWGKGADNSVKYVEKKCQTFFLTCIYLSYVIILLILRNKKILHNVLLWYLISSLSPRWECFEMFHLEADFPDDSRFGNLRSR